MCTSVAVNVNGKYRDTVEGDAGGHHPEPVEMGRSIRQIKEAKEMRGSGEYREKDSRVAIKRDDRVRIRMFDHWRVKRGIERENEMARAASSTSIGICLSARITTHKEGITDHHPLSPILARLLLAPNTVHPTYHDRSAALATAMLPLPIAPSFPI